MLFFKRFNKSWNIAGRLLFRSSKANMQLFKVMISVSLSQWIEVHLDVFLPCNLLFLRLCFEVWLTCHCYFAPKLDTHNVEVYQKQSSTLSLFLGYQKASDVSLPFLLFNFCFKMLMWSLRSKGLSNKTPRYLVQVFCLIFWPLKWKFSSATYGKGCMS